MFLIQQVATICVESMLDRALSRKSLQQTLRRSMQATCGEVGISSVTVQKIARQYLLGAAPGFAA
jgi:RNase P/RNase MRP subunit POP5